MKRALFFSFLFSILFSAQYSYGQNLCKVLMPRIADSYTGSCKGGLADGKGEAAGVDRYTGEFKKGLPDGEGTYIWQTGEVFRGMWKKGMRDGRGELAFNRDSVLTGIWKEDKYVGKEVVAPYTIGYKNNVGRVTFQKMGDDRFYVKYKFSRSGEASSFIAITDLMLQGSSGTENISTNFTGFENITFPFEGKVQFTSPSAMNPNIILNCELRFKINEPGPWLISIYY